jgi:hypothetical protein
MRYILSSFFLIFFISVKAQYLPDKGYLEMGSAIGAGDELPFWLHSNKYGQFSTNKTNIYGKAGFQKSTSDTSKKFNFGYGIDLINRNDNKNMLFFHQAFIKIKYRIAQIHAGKMEEQFGEQDKNLSSGNLLFSGNSRTIPEISFNFPEYIPLIKGYVDVKGYISHGWMNDNRYIKNYYLHHKNAYIRLGSKFPVTFSYGLEHYAQWGGYSPEYGQLPNKFNDFKKVFFARSGGNEAPWIDSINRLGNHLGSKNFTFEVKTKPVFAKLYWQYMFEDASKDHWENISDGLWGISLEFAEKKIIKKIVIEYINTTNQSGPIHLWNDTIHLGGEDQYFNNVVYRNGWKYYDRIIGTPFITPETNTNEIGTNNNCIRAWHFGFMGTINNSINYRLFITQVYNYGTIIPNIGSYIYSYKSVKKIRSVMFETLYKLKNNFQMNVTISADFGNTTHNLGVHFALRKNFNQ